MALNSAGAAPAALARRVREASVGRGPNGRDPACRNAVRNAAIPAAAPDQALRSDVVPVALTCAL